jgi:hypothetical protein
MKKNDKFMFVQLILGYTVPLGTSICFTHFKHMPCSEINPFVNVCVGNLEINFNQNMTKSRFT